jgi:hypothetical protein
MYTVNVYYYTVNVYCKCIYTKIYMYVSIIYNIYIIHTHTYSIYNRQPSIIMPFSSGDPTSASSLRHFPHPLQAVCPQPDEIRVSDGRMKQGWNMGDISWEYRLVIKHSNGQLWAFLQLIFSIQKTSYRACFSLPHLITGVSSKISHTWLGWWIHHIHHMI